MKKIFYSLSIFLLLSASGRAQETVYPAKANKGRFYIVHGTVHVGNGQVLDNATIEVNDDKIVAVSASATAPSGARIIDAKGKQVYPGLILPATDIGLKEIASGVRGSNDYRELGDFNPDIRSIVAYNTDSKFINLLKANGILLASIVPEGGTISGTSSVVQFDAWNWEDATYKKDAGIHINMPSFIARFGRRFGGGGGGGRFGGGAQQEDPAKIALDKVQEIKDFFNQAKAYLQEPTHAHTNLKFEAVKGLFSRQQKLFVHADQVKQMLVAIDFAKEFGFDVVIVGGSESFQIADLLKKNNIAVILGPEHALPAMEDDDVDQPYKTPAALQKAGVLYALNDTHEESRYRNLPFNAGTAVTYGLTKEEALQAITLNAAKILGIADKTGSIEAGKDANIVICDGDILDMTSSEVSAAFIQGRQVSLDNKQKELYEKYLYKYGIK
ncbi:MAG TPA: amidohydrolase family protein [Sediminibacterium sp.]|nr:amidohydrolase family protein [Sediminibacterium sp.]